MKLKQATSVKALFFSALFVIGINTCLAQADIPESQNYQGIQYITGGIGSEESDAIIELGKKWPLTLEFSQDHPQRSLWVADVAVKITNEKQKVIFNVMSEGPILLINLEPGTYNMEFVFEKRPLKRKIKIEEGKPQKLPIAWPIQ
ncbi:carboxypeptidase regulatory-like domain-containing protein [Polynucleobacter sp. MWH-Spelu-300-X4]|uniref:hypothetical protein n=1 Tax=Polynucleobacter sp. MWH-Spelu-300-X4 TaxID=2689109 RepID=UPI001BFE0CC6|nr:hypothetical protein [Polynucleobacter sp. MWH-Spelu-300-X4]QWD79111.1 carboxypeptidase regulatory-like domain-containing protein [Polynucleobacter sp. MWH-Spelu-300-X4]